MTTIAAEPVRDARSRARWQERGEIVIPLLLLLGIALVVPANLNGPLLHDSFAIDWVWADQFTAELARGNLYPRWLPLSNGGLGAPVFYYYPPLAFHLTAIFGLLGLTTYASIIAAFATAFAASGIACWCWLLRRSQHPFLGACLFMAAPYHLFDYSVRGALAEVVGIALIPVIAIGLRRIVERRGGIALAAIAYGALIGTHLPLALLVSVLFVAPYALAHRRQLARVAASVAVGIGLAAVYLLPALVLEPHRDVGQLYRTPDLRTGYWSILEANWQHGFYTMVFLIIAALVVAGVYSAIVRRDRWARYSFAVAVIAAGLIPFFWSLPLIEKVQFPYRALPLAEFALATALARLPVRAMAVSVTPALLLSAAVLPGFAIPGADLAQLRATHPDVAEYRPRGVMRPGQTKAPLQELLAPRIPPPRVPGMIVEPTFYFPAWSCGAMEPRTQLLMHRPDCQPRLVLTPVEKIGAAISLACALLLLLFAWLVKTPANAAARARIPRTRWRA